MMFIPEHRERTEYRFDAFCRKAMRFEARNCYKAIKRKKQREVSLDYLMEEQYFEPSCLDDDPLTSVIQSKPTDFCINGQIVTIEDKRLALALLQLSADRRELILLFYFLDTKEKALAAMYGRSRSTINYRKNHALKILQQEMERCEDEETQLQISALRND